MNIYLFSGVPFDNTYKNVFVNHYNNDSVLHELIRFNYLLAEVGNVAKYNCITNTLNVERKYINCNYVVITDTIDGEYKEFYYFVGDTAIVSTSTIQLSLELDVFHTYYGLATIKNSKVIQCSCMHDIYQNITNYTIPVDKLGSKTTPRDTTYLYNNSNTTYTLLAVISSASDDLQDNSLINKYILMRTGSFTDIIRYKNALLKQRIWLTSTPSGDGITIQVYDMYILPYDITGKYTYTDTNDVYVKVNESTTLNFHRLSAITTPSVNLYTITKKLSPVFTFIVGTKSNNIKLDGNGETLTFNVNLYIDNYGSINILLLYGDNILDITSDFSVDVYNDEYYIWKNQNKNTLKAQNKTNYINGAMSIASSVVGLGIGLGTGSVNGVASGTLGIASGITSMATNNMNRKATLKDAKQKTASRNDITSANSTYTLLYGVYIEKYEPVNIDDIIDDVNWYGFLFTTYDNDIKSSIITGLGNEYINIQCDDVNIICDKCDVSSLNKLKAIFNSGVRIWSSIDKATILADIWVANSVDSED